jgi:hypothetical protein
MESHARCTGTTITLPTGEALLVVEIAINCPHCGQYTMGLAGHHLRMVRDALVEMIDLHPRLTGRDEDVKTIEKIQFSGRGGTDPGVN